MNSKLVFKTGICQFLFPNPTDLLVLTYRTTPQGGGGGGLVTTTLLLWKVPNHHVFETVNAIEKLLGDLYSMKNVLKVFSHKSYWQVACTEKTHTGTKGTNRVNVWLLKTVPVFTRCKISPIFNFVLTKNL